MAWSLHEDDNFLEPLEFSSGKSQEGVVDEVLAEVKNGHKVIFIHGVCGTGKSAIALNIARELGKTSIVVPGKNLQMQYKDDYEGKKYVMKKEVLKLAGKEIKEKLKIHVMTGRNNHKCKFLEDNKLAIPKVTREVPTTLSDAFMKHIEKIEEKSQNIQEKLTKDKSADNWDLPCKIEIKEKNMLRIREYLKQNQHVDENKFNNIKDIKRLPIAAVCPYWSPVIPEKYEINTPTFKGARKRKYEGLGGEKYIFYQRKKGCPFYEQFNSYVDADVIVFNSLKYKLETALNRKPKTEVEIIDECDEFLDSLTNQRVINIDRLLNSLNYVFSSEPFALKIKKEMTDIILHMRNDKSVEDAIATNEIIPLKKSGLYDLLKLAIKNPDFFATIDDENYLFDFEETSRMFQDFLDETFVTFEKFGNSLKASLVTTNLEKKFKELLNKNKIFILMSGTLHAEIILKNIFGIEDFITIKAETRNQGQIELQKTGLEMDCKYSNFSNNKHSREDYLKALDKSIELAKKPCLVHVNAFRDLPSSSEIAEFRLNNIKSREELEEEQKKDKTGELVKEFKSKKTNILFSTRSKRGIDFPGDECNSIVFTKYPNPNVQDPFWKILSKTRPTYYWDFYKDKAVRELWQRVYRGVRFNRDHVYVLSPDIRVIEAFKG
jgi:Rad3-related DNA helicase